MEEDLKREEALLDGKPVEETVRLGGACAW